ncbi:MAG: D-alanyl-D-alanine carboxypeptidase family protein [Bacteroidetes bacterium]|nr:MAG: D-alanyl-D-alanine carboxypeptidase family protein [Bacteroidota bacterium]
MVPLPYLLGQFDPAQDSLFVQMDDAHTGGSARGRYLHHEAYAAFKKMHAAATADGISLTILSATRNFAYQKGIWEAKWTGARAVGGRNLAQAVADPEERARIILRYSSMPGTSRHHWGTDFDLNAFENSYFQSGKGLKEYEWLKANAADFGFGQPYTEKGPDRPHGYEEERWHWSYLPVAKIYLAAYQAQVCPEMITGFAGAETAASIDVIAHYVGGVAPDCQ